MKEGKAILIQDEPFLLYDDTVYLRASKWFPQKGINEKTILPLSDEYFKLIADVDFMEEYHARMNGLEFEK